jgi:hypothetical protein
MELLTKEFFSMAPYTSPGRILPQSVRIKKTINGRATFHTLEGFSTFKAICSNGFNWSQLNFLFLLNPS